MCSDHVQPAKLIGVWRVSRQARRVLLKLLNDHQHAALKEYLLHHPWAGKESKLYPGMMLFDWSDDPVIRLVYTLKVDDTERLIVSVISVITSNVTPPRDPALVDGWKRFVQTVLVISLRGSGNLWKKLFEWIAQHF